MREVLLTGAPEDFTCRTCHKPMAGPLMEGKVIVGVCPECRFVRTFVPHLQTITEYFEKMRVERPLSKELLDRVVAAALACGHRPREVTIQLIETEGSRTEEPAP
jgi:hypothetical protein